jgi:hypothetical protein
VPKAKVLVSFALHGRILHGHRITRERLITLFLFQELLKQNRYDIPSNAENDAGVWALIVSEVEEIQTKIRSAWKSEVG